MDNLYKLKLNFITCRYKLYFIFIQAHCIEHNNEEFWSTVAKVEDGFFFFKIRYLILTSYTIYVLRF